MKKTTKLLLCLILSFILINPLSLLAAVTDIQRNWAEKEINVVLEEGLFTGYPDGTFKPDSPIAQSEFFAIVNRGFGFSKMAEQKPIAGSTSQWYTDEYSKAEAQGYLNLLKTDMIKPNEPINRQEVGAILADVLKLNPDLNAAEKFSDSMQIEAWAKGLIGAFASNGYIKGYLDNTYRPHSNITRAEAATMINRVIGKLFNKPGTYGYEGKTEIIKGNVTVNVSGITLKNTVIEGNLFITEGVESGTVVLDRVSVNGTTTISGGGKGIYVKNSKLNKTIVSRRDNIQIFLIAQGNSNIKEIELQSTAKLDEENLGGEGFTDILISPILKADIELSGDFNIVNIIKGSPNVYIKKGIIKHLENNGKDTNITADKSVKIDTLTINQSLKMIGKCAVNSANITHDDVFIEANPVIVNILKGLKNVVCEALKPVKKVSGGSGGGGGGSSGGSSGGSGGSQTTITVMSVSTIKDLYVDYDTSRSAINLPNKVTVTLSDGTSPKVNAIWDNGTPKYDGTTPGEYTFTGTLGNLPTGVSNTKNYKASATVIVKEPEFIEIYLTGIEFLSDITVSKGTPLSVVKTVYLPEEVNISLSDNNNLYVSVEWDDASPTYDQEEEAIYVFSGDLELPNEITNPQNFIAEVRIIVGDPIVSEATIDHVYSLLDIAVPFGIKIADIELPEWVIVVLNDGREVYIDIDWNNVTPEYDGEIPGDYTFSGMLNLPQGITNPDNLFASVIVTVMKKESSRTVIEIDPLRDFVVDIGTGINELQIREFVDVTLSDGSSLGMQAIWDNGSPEYDGNVLGKYFFTGTLTMIDDIENPDNIEAKITVVVCNLFPTGNTLYEFDSLNEVYDSETAHVALDEDNKISGTASIKVSAKEPFSFDAEIDGETIKRSLYTLTAYGKSLDTVESFEFNLYVPEPEEVEYFVIKFYTDEDHCIFYENGIGNYELEKGWNKVFRIKNDFVFKNTSGKTSSTKELNSFSAFNTSPEQQRLQENMNALNDFLRTRRELQPKQSIKPMSIMEATDNSWDNITAMEIFVVYNYGGSPVVNIDKVGCNTVGVSQMLFTFDDGWYDVLEHGKPILDEKDFKATVWANYEFALVDAHSDRDERLWYMNEEELNSIYSDGWDIGNHTYSHPDDIEYMIYDDLKWEYEENQKWILSNGWISGAYHVCYPMGKYNELLFEILDELHVLTGRTTEYGIQALPVSDLYKLKCIYVGRDTPLDGIKSQVDRAVSTGSSIFFMLHRVEPEPEPKPEMLNESEDDYGEMAVSTADLEDLVNYIDNYVKQNKAEVVTISEWYKAYEEMYLKQ